MFPLQSFFTVCLENHENESSIFNDQIFPQNVFFGGIMVLISLLSFKMIFPNIRNSYTNGIISCSTSSLVAIMFKRSRIAGEISNVRTLINGALTGLVFYIA